VSSVNSFGGEFRINAGTSSTTSTENFASVFDSIKSVSNTMTRFGLIYLTDQSTNSKGTVTDWYGIYGPSIGTLPLAANRSWITLADLTKASVSGSQNSILLQQSNTGYKALAFKDQNAWINADTSGKLQLNATTSIDCNSDVNILSGKKVTFNASQQIVWGTGSPESVVTATVGSMFLRTDGGTTTTLYIKESGSGNTGWVAK
jgi:hypothetical protein